MKAKLYSSAEAFLADLDILGDYFTSLDPPRELPLPFDRPCGPEPYIAYSQIQSPHEDEGKFVLYLITEGADKDDHVVEGPLVDPDPTWSLLDGWEKLNVRPYSS